jgi:hypothetical protein
MQQDTTWVWSSSTTTASGATTIHVSHVPQGPEPKKPREKAWDSSGLTPRQCEVMARYVHEINEADKSAWLSAWWVWQSGHDPLVGGETYAQRAARYRARAAAVGEQARKLVPSADARIF